MTGNARRRVRPVPSLVVPSTPGTSGSDTAASIAALERANGVTALAAAKAVSHPTLRDQVQRVVLRSAGNWYAHGLGRVPRFVYLVPLDIPNSWWTWCWSRQEGDLDRDRIRISVLSDPAAAAFTGGGVVSDLGGGPSISVGEIAMYALLRLE